MHCAGLYSCRSNPGKVAQRGAGGCWPGQLWTSCWLLQAPGGVALTLHVLPRLFGVDTICAAGSAIACSAPVSRVSCNRTHAAVNSLPSSTCECKQALPGYALAEPARTESHLSGDMYRPTRAGQALGAAVPPVGAGGCAAAGRDAGADRLAAGPHPARRRGPHCQPPVARRLQVQLATSADVCLLRHATCEYRPV